MSHKYLVKIGSQLRIIHTKKLENFSIPEAIAIGVASAQEQQRQLLKDALEGDRYFYGRKVVDALEISLNKLEEQFPEIRQYIKALTSKNLYCCVN